MIRTKHVTSGKAGFTIVELMIATLVFSVILIVITSGVIHFTTDYYKGVNSSATQTAARNVANVIAQNLQYGGGLDAYTPNTAVGMARMLCVGGTQIDYNLGGQLGAGGVTYGAYVWNGNCTGVHPAGSGIEYLGPNMRVTNIDITQVAGAVNNLYKISVGVTYGDPDLLCAKDVLPTTSTGGCASSAPPVPATPVWWATHGPSVGCKGGAGSQFCAAAHLSTEVVSRFGH